MKSRIPPKSSFKSSAPVKDSSQTSVQTSAHAVILAKGHMKAGECQKAIDVYNVEYRKYPHDEALVREYVKSIENIKSAADKALDKEDFAAAGGKYDVLLKNYAHFNGFDKKLSFNSTHLNEKLYYCKKALFKQGLQEYRKDNLSRAIALWQDLFAMDPQNADIKELLRTAKLQQKNLQEKE
jgi:tetratricopeptide (TPR) repeat protein